MNLKLIAQRILIELESVKDADFNNNSIDSVALLNEALRDAKALADAILDDESKAA